MVSVTEPGTSELNYNAENVLSVVCSRLFYRRKWKEKMVKGREQVFGEEIQVLF